MQTGAVKLRPPRHPARADRHRPGRFGQGLLVAYWAGCVAIIGVGLSSLYPAVNLESLLRPSVEETGVRRLTEIAVDSPQRTRPFRNCADAHRAGAYDIPAVSPLYAPRQDGDSDGFACEPY